MPEFKPNTRPAPEHLEHKSTVDTLIGYDPSPQPHVSRYGSELTEDEVKNSFKAPGTPHAGNPAPTSGGTTARTTSTKSS